MPRGLQSVCPYFSHSIHNLIPFWLLQKREWLATESTYPLLKSVPCSACGLFGAKHVFDGDNWHGLLLSLMNERNWIKNNEAL